MCGIKSMNQQPGVFSLMEDDASLFRRWAQEVLNLLIFVDFFFLILFSLAFISVREFQVENYHCKDGKHNAHTVKCVAVKTQSQIKEIDENGSQDIENNVQDDGMLDAMAFFADPSQE